MHPLVTVSIPLYKCEDFLLKCLESVRSQTYSNLEVTLINDQTPDRSVDIAKQFIAENHLQNWKIYHLDHNSGLSVVRNKGINTAKGKYLFFLDSDDQIMPKTIEKMTDLAEKERLEMVVGNTTTINLDTGNTNDHFVIKTSGKIIEENHKVFEAFIEGLYPSPSWNKLHSVQFLRDNALYFTPRLFAQDELQSFQTALKLNRIGFLPELTYKYFLHKNSVIHNRDRRHFENWGVIVCNFTNALEEESDAERHTLIRKHIINYKSMTLIMNWKAKQDDADWLYSFALYKKYPNLNFRDYFSRNYTLKTKKNALKLELPGWLALTLFKFLYYR